MSLTETILRMAIFDIVYWRILFKFDWLSLYNGTQHEFKKYESICYERMETLHTRRPSEKNNFSEKWIINQNMKVRERVLRSSISH